MDDIYTKVFEIVRLRREMHYADGYRAGYADFKLLENKPNTNGYTTAEYCRITQTYLDAIQAPYPTDYQRGYGDGGDARTKEMGFTESTPEDLEALYDFGFNV